MPFLARYSPLVFASEVVFDQILISDALSLIPQAIAYGRSDHALVNVEDGDTSCLTSQEVASSM